MRAAVRIRDRIGEAEDLVGVAVVVLQHALDQDVFFDVLAVLVLHLGLPRAGQLDHLRVKNRLAFAQFLDEFLDAEFVDKKGLFRLALDTFVGQADLEAAIEESQLTHARPEALEDKFRGGENLGIRQERDLRPGLLFIFQLAQDGEFLRRFALGERHKVNLAVSVNLGFEPFGEGVDALGADAVKTAAEFVGALTEFAAGVEVGQHELNGRNLPLRVHVDRNAAAIVADGTRAVGVDGHIDVRAETGQMFVDRVVEDLVNAVMQAAFVGVADVHPRPLAHRFQTLKLVDLRRAVCRILGQGCFRDFLLFRRHKISFLPGCARLSGCVCPKYPDTRPAPAFFGRGRRFSES